MQKKDGLIPIGTPIAIVVDKPEDVSAFENYKFEESTPEEKPIEVETKPEVIQEKQKETIAEPTINSDKINATPAAKTQASISNVDLSSVTPSGPNGRIQLADVNTQKSPSRIELTSIRKTIAKRLTHSSQTIPYYSLSSEINISEVLDFRKSLKQFDIKTSINDFLIKAADKALVDVPEVNRYWMDDHMLQNHQSDICLAVSTDSGLITPVIRSVGSKSILKISEESSELIEKARSSTLKEEEYTGGTFTISNLGGYDIKQFTAIINPPQSAILAVGSGYDNKCIMTLGCDHRVIDGAVGAEWLQSFKKYLENPVLLAI